MQIIAPVVPELSDFNSFKSRVPLSTRIDLHHLIVCPRRGSLIAGASDDRTLFRRVDSVIAGQARQGLQFDHDGSVHVRLARAQALVMFGKARDALAVFATLEKCDLASANPASSALRWRVRALVRPASMADGRWPSGSEPIAGDVTDGEAVLTW